FIFYDNHETMKQIVAVLLLAAFCHGQIPEDDTIEPTSNPNISSLLGNLLGGGYARIPEMEADMGINSGALSFLMDAVLGVMFPCRSMNSTSIEIRNYAPLVSQIASAVVQGPLAGQA